MERPSFVEADGKLTSRFPVAFLSTKMIDSLVMLCSLEIVADRDELFALSKILCIFESSMEWNDRIKFILD